MPKPKTKNDLEQASKDGFRELLALVDSLPAARDAKFPFEHRDRNVRDVLAHVLEWQLMMLSWYEEGMNGQQPIMPKEGFTWRTTPELNQTIWEQYQKTALARVRKALQDSHGQLMQKVEQHSESELFTKRHYPWTGSTSLGAYLTSALSSHYAWATKLIKRYARSVEEDCK